MRKFLKIMENLEKRITSVYYSSFCELMFSYVKTIEYLQKCDKRTFDMFSHWIEVEGMSFFYEIANNIRAEKLDDRFNAFMEVYKSYLDDAMDEESKFVALDFLYLIPEKMRDDFQKFGFLESEKQQFVWECSIPINRELEYECYWEPGNDCQVSLL